MNPGKDKRLAMNVDTIFTVKNEDLERLTPQGAVEFFRNLLWAEARRWGIPISKIRVSIRINVPDGGVDAIVEDNMAAAQSGPIKAGQTSYQIKAGKSFEPWQKAVIKKELFGKKAPGKENLGESIRACLEASGTYVLVCTGIDLVEPQPKQAVEHLETNFKLCGYKHPKVEVWSQNTLIGFLQLFPSLVLKVNGRDSASFQTHQSWSENDTMKKAFVSGKTQDDFIANLQTELRQNYDTVHVRVWGEPGIGKTKLVLEATRADDLRPLVIYCSARQFRDSFLMNEILKDDNQFAAILVIDECEPASCFYIWDHLKHRGPRIKLVTIYNEYDETSGNITYVGTPPLNDEQISTIIQGYGIPKDSAGRWLDLCSGSPRVAHVIGENLVNYPEDLLRSPDTVDVWNRYVVGRDEDPNSQQVQQRKLVLQHLALFKRFGYERSVVAEAQAIAKKIQQADPQITWSRFQALIHELKARKILQGEYTLYITPKALHIKLWTEWWGSYGHPFNLDEFSQDLTPTLLDWFYEMFKYAAESEAASYIVKELLGENGPFQNDEYLQTRLGGRFFRALTEADPKSALKCLMRTVGTWNREKLLQFRTGRREVVWAIEKIVVWRKLFADGARLLLALGEAENESYSNNASGIFAGLFTSKLSPTEASPPERLPILQEALGAPSKERRLLALKACDRALESRHLVRRVGAEYQGLRREPQLWMPQTYGELFEAYRQVWQLLRQRLECLPEDERREGVDVLLRHARGIGSIPDLTDRVINTVSELAQKPYGDRKKILETVVQILHYDRKELPVETRKRWEQLRDELIGDDFHSRLRRYVGMSLLLDKFDDQEKYLETHPQIKSLAQEAAESKEVLRPELSWLVTTEAENGYIFGYELGNRDQDFSRLPTLLEAQRNASENASVYFLGGYFRSLFEKDQKRWEDQLDALSEEQQLNVWIPELAQRSGLTDRIGMRILSLAQKGIVGTDRLGLFVFGAAVCSLSEEVFKKWMKFLMSRSDTDAIRIALTLYDFYYLYKKENPIFPPELTLKLLTHPSLFQKSETGQFGQMVDYHWAKIGKAFVQRYPEKSLELADTMLEHFGESGTIVDGFHSEPQSVLAEIMRRYPQEVWRRVTQYLGPPRDTRAFYLTRWLQGDQLTPEKSESPLTLIPLETIGEWVDEDAEKRARYFARFVPKTLSPEEWKTCLARKVLVRYGQREDVRNSLMANFSTEAWAGPLSLHEQEKKQKLLDLMKGEDNENVKRWIDEYVSFLDRQIEQAKIDEEREF
ncbi:hypothetical protein HYR99_40025 [Candidatus Poribacteria bacterium]|nr:hypothetical protein [Candidatus Poribacteria bacterium]